MTCAQKRGLSGFWPDTHKTIQSQSFFLGRKRSLDSNSCTSSLKNRSSAKVWTSSYFVRPKNFVRFLSTLPSWETGGPAAEEEKRKRRVRVSHHSLLWQRSVCLC